MTDVRNFLLDIHSYFRWALLLLAIVGSARSLVSLMSREAKFMRLDIGLSIGYSVALDLQGLFGALLVIVDLSIDLAAPWSHLLIMVPAIVVGNLNRRFRSRPDRARHQAQLAIFIGTLMLISLGLAAIDLLPFTDPVLNVITISLALIGLAALVILVPLYLAHDASRRGHRNWAIIIVVFTIFLSGWLASFAYLASVDRRSSTS